MACQITGNALCEGTPVGSPHNGPVTRKMFPSQDIVMPTKAKQSKTMHTVWISQGIFETLNE